MGIQEASLSSTALMGLVAALEVRRRFRPSAAPNTLAPRAPPNLPAPIFLASGPLRLLRFDFCCPPPAPPSASPCSSQTRARSQATARGVGGAPNRNTRRVHLLLARAIARALNTPEREDETRVVAISCRHAQLHAPLARLSVEIGDVRRVTMSPFAHGLTSKGFNQSTL